MDHVSSLKVAMILTSSPYLSGILFVHLLANLSHWLQLTLNLASIKKTGVKEAFSRARKVWDDSCFTGLPLFWLRAQSTPS
jgi:hypothetical protein